MIDLRQGDCISKMKEMEDNSVDLILTDPPYFLTDNNVFTNDIIKNNKASKKGFMGKEWDGFNIEVEETDFFPDELML